MSLSTSMNNALSGLAAASRGAQVVSSNVANATTEGYGVRVLELSSRANTGSGQGVQVDGVRRVVDDNVIAERRLADAASGEGERMLAASEAIVSIIGEPDRQGSLAQQISAFEGALSLSISRPDSTARLDNLLVSSKSLTDTFARMTADTQGLREDADRRIGELVERLNTTLKNVDDLNALILRAGTQGDGVPALLDERQRQIDSIADIIPIRQIERENGAIALYTPTGTGLLDIEPAEFGFQPKGTITADMTIQSGALSGLTLNGRALDPTGLSTAIAGGSLAAEFAVRDETAPEFQAQLDALAAELVSRFSDPAIDDTLLPGDPGLFTDSGAAFDPLTLVGLAGRLQVNAAVDPSRGGETWRLREGIGALSELARGDGTRLAAIETRFAEARSPVVAQPGQGATGFAEMADRLLSVRSLDLTAREQTAAFQSARFQTLDDAVRADGVNTDQEMQKLLLIERFYAANAKVIETVDEMLSLLSRI